MMKAILLLVLATVVAAQNGCSDADINIIGNTDFYKKLTPCAKSHLGNVQGTADCMNKYSYGDLGKVQESCVQCYAEGAGCGAKNCKMGCLLNECSKGCIKCTRKYCADDLWKCVGYDEASLPDPCPKINAFEM
eukprot:GDKH01023835.1.p1 GENE.GDKH01023835.1~~GDKH01023835.1.p1  ORF type:complete len:134 (+),score=38.32 GDKH01023835.1:116-517(+)